MWPIHVMDTKAFLDHEPLLTWGRALLSETAGRGSPQSPFSSPILNCLNVTCHLRAFPEGRMCRTRQPSNVRRRPSTHLWPSWRPVPSKDATRRPLTLSSAPTWRNSCRIAFEPAGLSDWHAMLCDDGRERNFGVCSHVEDRSDGSAGSRCQSRHLCEPALVRFRQALEVHDPVVRRDHPPVQRSR